MPVTKRISLIEHVPVDLRNDVVLVVRALAHAGDEALPDARVAAAVHRMGTGIPPVEVANDRDQTCAGRPDAKKRSRQTVDDAGVRSKLFVDAVVRAFIEQKQVVGIQQRRVRRRGRNRRGWIGRKSIYWLCH